MQYFFGNIQPNQNSRRKGLDFEFDSEDSDESVEETNAHKNRATLDRKESYLPHKNDQPKEKLNISQQRN